MLSLQELIGRLSRTGEGDDEIYRTEDQFGPVVVRENNGLRTLSFDSLFEQSAMRVGRPLELVHEYTQAMLLAMLFKEPERVTLLGLGGGSLLRTLHHCCPEADFQVVELRESVIRVALSHFAIPSDGRVSIHNCDSIDYINCVDRQSSDLILSDMYQAYSMEGFQSTNRFLEQCWQLLTEDGWLVINFHELPDFDNPYMRRMRELYAEVLCCGTTSGNYIVMCGKQKLEQALPGYEDALIELGCRLDASLARSFARMFKLGTAGNDASSGKRAAPLRSRACEDISGRTA